MRNLKLPAALLAFFCNLSTAAMAAEPFDIAKRQVIDMPPQVGPVLRGEMVDLLGSLRQVYALAGEGKHQEAADLAEKLIGRSAMGQHGGNIRPGMFMPPEMRTMAQFLHHSASDWSFALRTGDRLRADAAFAQVLGTCVGCHQNFQLRNR